MPINHPKFGTREVYLSYWYTAQQIDEVGRHWQGEDEAQRTYIPLPATYKQQEDALIPTECTGRSGLEVRHLRGIDFPHSFLLPINKGGSHWCSMGVKLTQDAQGKPHIELGFSDSLSSEKDINCISWVNEELFRLAYIFYEAYPECEINFQVYPHAWKQSDTSSCGPYSLANGMRFLAGKKAEPNPGRQALREAQLQSMQEGGSVTQCSKSVELEQMIVWWLQEVSPQSLPKLKKMQSLCIEDIITGYASQYNLNQQALKELIRLELNLSPSSNLSGVDAQLRFARRMTEVDSKQCHHLLAQEAHWKKTQNQREEADVQLIETTCEALEKGLGAQVLAYLYQGHTEESVRLIAEKLQENPIPDETLLAMHRLIGVQQSSLFDAKSSYWGKKGEKYLKERVTLNAYQFPKSLYSALSSLKTACEDFLKHSKSDVNNKHRTETKELLLELTQPRLTKQKLISLKPKLERLHDSLAANQTSKGEFALKLFAALSLVIGLILMFVRLAQTHGKQANFFKPFEHVVSNQVIPLQKQLAN